MLMGVLKYVICSPTFIQDRNIDPTIDGNKTKNFNKKVNLEALTEYDVKYEVQTNDPKKIFHKSKVFSLKRLTKLLVIRKR